MAENSEISWTDNTFNPWVGCTKVASGCANCYAERDFDKRKHFSQWGPHGTRVLTSEANWKKPLKWNRDAVRDYEIAQAQWVQDCCVGHKSYPEPTLNQFRKRVFCASLADVFEDWDGQPQLSNGQWVNRNYHMGRYTGLVGCSLRGGSNAATIDDIRHRLFAMIDATPYLDWLLLTKRPQNILQMWDDQNHRIDPEPYRHNVWLGTSISNQDDADRNIPELLKCRDLSQVLFVSAEPLLGPVDLHGSKLDWVICGGESGPIARPMHPDWARRLRDQCQSAGVPFHFKQWGEWIDKDAEPGGDLGEMFRKDHAAILAADGSKNDGHFRSLRGDTIMQRLGKKVTGRLLDGREWNEFPVLNQ